jgi:enterochelin esterase family protein
MQGIAMTKDDRGVWETTVGPLEPGAYRYNFNVNGVAVIDPRSPSISESNNNVWSMVHVPGAEFMDTADVPHGAVAAITYPSSALHKVRRMHIYTPPGYEVGASRYPVFYLLHGAGDSDESWTSVGRAGFILDNLIAAKKAVPMIVVMPFNGTNNPPAPQGAFEDYMLKDLIPYVDAKYRVAPGRENRAMAGLSAGGAATYNVGLKHLELFSAFGLFSAAGGGGADFATRYPDLAKNAKDANAKIRVFWIGCGTEDPLDAGAKTLDAELTRLQITHTYKDRPGGHVWPVWRWALSEFAPTLFHK